MTDLYLDADEESHFFQEIFAERPTRAQRDWRALNANFNKVLRELDNAAEKPCAVIQLDEAALGIAGALK